MRLFILLVIAAVAGFCLLLSNERTEAVRASAKIASEGIASANRTYRLASEGGPERLEPGPSSNPTSAPRPEVKAKPTPDPEAERLRKLRELEAKYGAK